MLIIESDLAMETRKPLSYHETIAGKTWSGFEEYSTKFSHKEEVDSKIIDANALMLLSNEFRDLNTTNVFKEIIGIGTYANLSQTLTIDKSNFLLDILKYVSEIYKLSTSLKI